MNTSPSPSVPPRGVRDLIATMRSRPLPARSRDEIDRWSKYIRKSSRIPHLTRCAPPGATIATSGVPEGGR
jgi:hypothetical protein